MAQGPIITVLTSLLLCVSLGIGLVRVYNPKKPTEFPNKNSSLEGEREDAVCLTAGCVQAASTITTKMNPAVDPCDDFYEFACGGFLNSTTIPEDDSGVSNRSPITDAIRTQLQYTLEEPSLPGEPRPFRLAKDLYQACINETAIEKAGLEPLHEVLEKLGKWPVVEGNDWKEEDFDWIESVRMFRELGYPVDHFLKFEIRVDMKNGTKNLITLGPATLTLSKLWERTSEEAERYLEYMVNIAVFLGADRQRAIEELVNSVRFEKQLSNMPYSDVDEKTLTHNFITIAELVTQYPSINWKKYINNLLPENKPVTDDQVIIVQSLGFVNGLEKLLKITSKRDLANYSVWKAVEASIKYLGKNIEAIGFKYDSASTGQIINVARWKRCIKIVTEKLSIATSALYVRKFSKEDTKKAVIEMVANIREQFTEILKKAEWINAEMRNRALKKIAAMSTHVSHSDELFDDKKLEEYYADLELSITSDNFFSSILNLTRFEFDKSIDRLKKPAIKHTWDNYMNSAVVNALYEQSSNEIDIPAGIIQGIYFSSERPQYMNYGAIGHVIGHEITHAFDNVGIYFDDKGNFVDGDMTDFVNKYSSKMSCLRHQYDDYREASTRLNVNGWLTLSENIADNGGTKVAYMAYNEWVKRNAREEKLPGLKYSPKQLFWISAANAWCSKFRTEAMRTRIRKDSHSPAKFRVNGPFSNIPEFAADFNCEFGSPMNPIKCSVW